MCEQNVLLITPVNAENHLSQKWDCTVLSLREKTYTGNSGEGNGNEFLIAQYKQ